MLSNKELNFKMDSLKSKLNKLPLTTIPSDTELYTRAKYYYFRSLAMARNPHTSYKQLAGIEVDVALNYLSNMSPKVNPMPHAPVTLYDAYEAQNYLTKKIDKLLAKRTYFDNDKLQKAVDQFKLINEPTYTTKTFQIKHGELVPANTLEVLKTVINAVPKPVNELN